MNYISPTKLTAGEKRRELAQAKLDVVRNVLCYPMGFYNCDTLNSMDGLYSIGV